jgi:hypothetical protein
MKILERGETGTGILIEHDAGYISSSVTEHNKELFSNILKESFDTKTNQTIYVDCILQKWGVENRNGRIYPKEVLVPQIEAYSRQVYENSAFGEADHPETTVVSLQNIAHMIKDMWWGKGKEENILYGKLEIITTSGYMRDGIVSMVGDKIMEYLKRGGKLGISSRGLGSLKEDNGKNIVQADFELVCFDIVLSPSTPGAYLYPKFNNGSSSSMKEEIQAKSNNKVNERLILALDHFLI